MKRFDCMKALAPLLNEELVILSLGASVDEWYNAAPHMRAASLFQQQLAGNSIESEHGIIQIMGKDMQRLCPVYRIGVYKIRSVTGIIHGLYIAKKNLPVV